MSDTTAGIHDDLSSRVEKAVFAAIDEVNELMPPELWLAKDMATPILGEGASLDSIGFVNFVASLETAVSNEFDCTLSLMGGGGQSEIFATVGSVVRHVAWMLADRGTPTAERGVS